MYILDCEKLRRQKESLERHYEMKVPEISDKEILL